jgi:hypothetical protein
VGSMVHMNPSRRPLRERARGSDAGLTCSAGGRIIIVGTYGNVLYLLHAASGAVLQRLLLDQPVKGAAYVDKLSNIMCVHVYVGACVSCRVSAPWLSVACACACAEGAGGHLVWVW